MLIFLIAIPLVLVAIAIVLYLSTILYGAITGPFEGVFERRRFARYEARASQCDELIKHGEQQRALELLHAAFYPYTVRHRELASRVVNHHTALLSRAIALTAEAQGGTVRLLSLAKVDRLLSERSALQRRYFSASPGKGKDSRHEVNVALRMNGRDLSAALHQLVTEVAAMQRPPTLH